MATHHSYGRFCEYLLFYEHAWRSDPSTNRHAKWLKRHGFRQDVPFGVKIKTFCNIWPPALENHQKFGQFWATLRKFSLDFALALVVSSVNTHKSSSEPSKSIIVNRQCGAGNQNMAFCYLCDKLSVDGNADEAVEASIWIGWKKFRQLLTNRDTSLTIRGRQWLGGEMYEIWSGGFQTKRSTK